MPNLSPSEPITVTKVPQFISVVGPTQAVFGTTITFVVTPGESGQPLQMTLEGSTPGTCSLDGTSVRLIAPGQCNVVWHQAGDATYLDGSALQVVSVLRNPQVIAANLPTSVVVGSTVAFHPTGGTSGNPITADIVPFNTCTFNADHTQLTFIDVGQCLIQFAQAGNALYDAVPPFIVTIDIQYAAGGTFVAVPQLRLMDTRGPAQIGGRAWPLEVGQVRPIVHIAEIEHAPLHFVGVVLNVTVVDPEGSGWLRVWPCTGPRTGPLPPDSATTLNYQAGTGAWAGQVTVAAIPGDQRTCIQSYARTNLVVDLVGFLAPAGGSGYDALAPTRIVDTRSSLGGTRLHAGDVLHVDPSTTPGWPHDAAAAVVQLTAAGGTTPGFLRAFPCDQPMPNTSSVNTRGPQQYAYSSLITTTLAADGTFCVFSLAETDVVIDTEGAWSPSSHALVAAIAAPTRVVDTRVGRGGGRLGAGGVLHVPSQAWGGGSAAFLNVVAVTAAAPGFLTLYDCAQPRPTVSNLNFPAAGGAPDGFPTANAAQVQVVDGHDLCVYSLSDTDVVIDVSGRVT